MPIIIKSSIEGFRRAGMAHSKTPIEHADGTFTPAQIKQLEAEPRISVTITEGKQGSSNPSLNDSGAMDADRLASLVEHIASLDKDDASLWMDSGAPKASAMPNGTSAAERDAAWDAFVVQLDGEA